MAVIDYANTHGLLMGLSEFRLKTRKKLRSVRNLLAPSSITNAKRSDYSNYPCPLNGNEILTVLPFASRISS